MFESPIESIHGTSWNPSIVIFLETFHGEVKELFGEIEGMVSWRLSIQKDGISRGFGFAEFKTPEGAMELWTGGWDGTLLESCDKDKGDGLRWDLVYFICQQHGENQTFFTCLKGLSLEIQIYIREILVSTNIRKTI